MRPSRLTVMGRSATLGRDEAVSTLRLRQCGTGARSAAEGALGLVRIPMMSSSDSDMSSTLEERRSKAALGLGS